MWAFRIRTLRAPGHFLQIRGVFRPLQGFYSRLRSRASSSDRAVQLLSCSRPAPSSWSRHATTPILHPKHSGTRRPGRPAGDIVGPTLEKPTRARRTGARATPPTSTGSAELGSSGASCWRRADCPSAALLPAAKPTVDSRGAEFAGPRPRQQMAGESTSARGVFEPRVERRRRRARANRAGGGARGLRTADWGRAGPTRAARASAAPSRRWASVGWRRRRRMPRRSASGWPSIPGWRARPVAFTHAAACPYHRARRGRLLEAALDRCRPFLRQRHGLFEAMARAARTASTPSRVCRHRARAHHRAGESGRARHGRGERTAPSPGEHAASGAVPRVRPGPAGSSAFPPPSR